MFVSRTWKTRATCYLAGAERKLTRLLNESSFTYAYNTKNRNKTASFKTDFASYFVDDNNNNNGRENANAKRLHNGRAIPLNNTTTRRLLGPCGERNAPCVTDSLLLCAGFVHLSRRGTEPKTCWLNSAFPPRPKSLRRSHCRRFFRRHIFLINNISFVRFRRISVLYRFE